MAFAGCVLYADTATQNPNSAALGYPRVFTSQLKATVNSWNAPSIFHLLR